MHIAELPLQECYDRTRPLIAQLERRKFQILSTKNKRANLGDCVIAVNPSVFTDISEIPDRDSKIVQATHIGSRKRYTFVSSHVPGYSLDQPIPDKQEQLERGVETGDEQCVAIAGTLNRVATSAFQVICADMNTFPERHTDRFKAFEQVGFRCLRTNSPTEINGEPQTILRQRELDFIFFRSASRPNFLTRLFRGTSSLRANIQQSPFGIDDEDHAINPSDHKPIIANISVDAEPSYLYGFCAAIFSFLGRLFCGCLSARRKSSRLTSEV
jgi:hypothetical protein